MTANDDTRSTRHNTGDGALTDAALINYLDDVDCPVAISMLAKRTGATRKEVTTQLKALEQRDVVSVSAGLQHVTVQLVDDVEPVADGGCVTRLSAVDLTPAEVFQILSNERRRELIALLAQRVDATGGTDDLYVPVSPAAAVVCSEHSDFEPGSRLPEDAGHHATYNALTQTHLPLLDELGVVDYFDGAQKIAPTDVLLELAELMDVVDDAAAGDGE